MIEEDGGMSTQREQTEHEQADPTRGDAMGDSTDSRTTADHEPMPALDEDEAEGPMRCCVHGMVPLGQWCRQCNPLMR